MKSELYLINNSKLANEENINVVLQDNTRPIGPPPWLLYKLYLIIDMGILSASAGTIARACESYS